MAENRVYGIDLGTTYSCIAYVDENSKPVVVPNDLNELTTPSVVFFESEQNTVVGQTAKDEAPISPDRVVSTVKRMMGDPNWSCEHFGHTYLPQEVSAQILKKLVNDASQSTGDTIREVVITCPAYFSPTQKEATKQAGELIGLNVLAVIPEPTAAAYAYGMDKQTDGVVLVFDLGGGTFDITLIEIKAGAITVLGTGGDHFLGGTNWDETLARYLAQKFSESTGTDAELLMNDPEQRQTLLLSAEKMKKALSSKENAKESVRYEGERCIVEVTRQTFDEITASLLERTLSLTDALIAEVKEKGYDKIDKLLLVGGSTYMPQILNTVKTRYPYDVQQYRPNLSVAEGAAIFGFKCQIDKALLEEVKKESLDEATPAEVAKAKEKVAKQFGMSLPGLEKLANTRIVNITSCSFGIAAIDEADGQLRVSNLILKDDSVPIENTKTFGTAEEGQTGVKLRCFLSRLKGEKVELGDAEEIGTEELHFNRPMPLGSGIQVTLGLDMSGILKVHALDLTSSKAIDVEFKTSGSIMSLEELEAAKQHAMDMKISS